MIRIALADDHAIIRDGIRALLVGEADLQIAAEASNGRQLLELLAEIPVDVVLLDINLPEMDGHEAIRQLQRHYPGIRVLVLSMLSHEEYVTRVLEAGALGYALKNVSRDEILFAIRSVAAGRRFLCTELGVYLLHRLSKLGDKQAPGEEKKPPVLSRRETEVLKLIGEGFTTGEIAEKLFTSKRTIETHRQNIIEKTQVRNTAALIRYAVTQGLL
ncbi:DNA-binding NarL/FixJ family response regulator [Hymenobacter luteus]|uniref:DNA-binding NarL/FixJ family response regulator n=2 Tax=Hymenobacter TaxID=89966 RepID=A0A7W9WDP9_9BACT|nr:MULTISPECIES: response regulator transcription factor [Hymenobacter]MBB4601685.1 DNA-binding NarL/FixJ family response regulator [Hymenobacter latericoloratus]MBB6059887.1 DNA-binding NarL/FixJ family response regulator [Hymenobacter luteus]